MKAIQAKKNKEKNEANQSKQKSISSYFGAKPTAKQEISEPKVADENLKRKLELFKSDGNGESSFESQIKPTISTPKRAKIIIDTDSNDDKPKETTKAMKKLTPLEQQVKALKDKHPDTLLMVECGYRYRFFGKDAEKAAKILDMTFV